MRLGVILMAAAILTETTLAAPGIRYAKGLKVPADADYGVPFLSWDSREGDLPAKYDLRDEGLVTPVRNQASCGSCWAFAGVAAMESAMLKVNPTPLDLSEQEVVSCDNDSNGCGGGWQPFDYMISHGVGSEADFPYAAGDLRCKSITPVAKALKWGNIGIAGRRATVNEARKALVDFGALWITVGANSNWHNAGGVISRCANTRINHAVTLAGFETTGAGDQTKTHFLIKNSWGSNWADKGYVKTTLGCNNLGSHLSFVVPATSECAPPEFGLPKKIKLTRGENILPVPGLDRAGMEYTWYKVGGRVEGEGPIEVNSGENVDYVVRTRNTCGTWTQMVRINSK